MRTLLRNFCTSCPSLVKFERNLRKLKGGASVSGFYITEIGTGWTLTRKFWYLPIFRFFQNFLGNVFSVSTFENWNKKMGSKNLCQQWIRLLLSEMGCFMQNGLFDSIYYFRPCEDEISWRGDHDGTCLSFC